MEAGAIEVLTEKLAIFAPNARQVRFMLLSCSLCYISIALLFSWGMANDKVVCRHHI
jgi:hypothetical protein